MSIVFPICEMTPFMSKWTIQARVTVKSDLRTFNRNASQGKVFSVDLLDKDGGEIRASFFNQMAARSGFRDVCLSRSFPEVGQKRDA